MCNIIYPMVTLLYNNRWGLSRERMTKMEIKIKSERLIQLRQKKGMNKTEAAKLLNLSKMGYGRYESGERNPSYQTISFMAEKFGTTVEYLTGLTDDDVAQTITINRNDEASLFEIANSYVNGDDAFRKRLESYYNMLLKDSGEHVIPNAAEGDNRIEPRHTLPEFEWDGCTLVKYKGKKIDDMLDSEDCCIISAMCGVLEIVNDELRDDEIRSSHLKKKIMERIEQDCFELIPSWMNV